MHRHELEDALEDALSSRAPGWTVDGGGTLLSKVGEPLSCDMELEAADDASAADVIRLATVFLNGCAAPRGSYAVLDGGEPVAFGVTDGLGLYLNGTGLPAEVYASCHPDELIELLVSALGRGFPASGDGGIMSWWRGPTETALYLT